MLESQNRLKQQEVAGKWRSQFPEGSQCLCGEADLSLPALRGPF